MLPCYLHKFYIVEQRRKGGIYSCHFHHITPEYGTIILFQLGRLRVFARSCRRERFNDKFHVVSTRNDNKDFFLATASFTWVLLWSQVYYIPLGSIFRVIHKLLWHEGGYVRAHPHMTSSCQLPISVRIYMPIGYLGRKEIKEELNLPRDNVFTFKDQIWDHNTLPGKPSLSLFNKLSAQANRLQVFCCFDKKWNKDFFWLQHHSHGFYCDLKFTTFL